MADNKQEKDGLAVIIGGVFVLAIVFAAYNYFNKAEIDKSEVPEASTTEEVVISQEKDDKKPELKGDLNGKGVSTKADDALSNKEPELAATLGIVNTQPGSQEEPFGTWKPNNYNSGDIKGGSYVVKAGDTLWEIAEGAYGSGLEWHKVLEANKDSIGILAGGQQALIVPGQVLVLP